MTPAGYLQAQAYLTRTGVFVYTDSLGRITRELRHPDDVFDPESLQSMRCIPFTDLHPDFPVNANTAQFVQKGSIGDGISIVDNKYVSALVGVTNAELIRRIVDGGQDQTSCGYDCVIVLESGVFEGETYDVRQTLIRYDHVASVPKGRAGDEVRLRLDGAHHGIETAPTGAPGNQEDITMKKIVIDGKETEVTEVAALLIEAALQKRDTAAETAKQDAANAKKEADAHKARADVAEGELTKAKKAHADAIDPVNVRKAVADRVALEKTAGAVLGETKIDAMTDADVKKAVVAKLNPELKLDGASETYVEHAYDILLKTTKTDALDALRAAGTPAPGVRNDGQSDARKQMLADQAAQNAQFMKS